MLSSIILSSFKPNFLLIELQEKKPNKDKKQKKITRKIQKKLAMERSPSFT